MNSKQGKVGSADIEFITLPCGSKGEVSVRVRGKIFSVRYVRNGAHLTLHFDDRIVQYALVGGVDDEGRKRFSVRASGGHVMYSGLSWVRESDQVSLGGQGGVKHKALRVKSQMPGKIVKVLVTVGQKVEAGAPLIVMEAMKMENEIRSTAAGTVKEVKVQAGQAVETGVLLISIES